MLFNFGKIGKERRIVKVNVVFSVVIYPQCVPLESFII